MVHIDSESENSVELVGGAGKVARLTFRIRHNDFALRNAADEEALNLRIERDALWNELRVLEPEGHRRGGRLRFLVGEFLANRLELRVVPHSIESRVAHGDEPKLPTPQA